VNAKTFDSRDWTNGGRSRSAPVTARMVLFGRDPRSLVPRGGWSAFRETLSHVRPQLRPLVERELAAAVAGLLDVDLGDVLLDGWRAHTKLRAAARVTVDNPGSTELVTLTRHRVSVTHTPHVDLVVDDMTVATVEVTIEMVVDVDGLIATVRAGRLTALHSGQCEVRVTLEYAGRELASGVAHLDAPTTVSLGEGIDLLDHSEPSRDVAGTVSVRCRRW
jgi:hypothetical protein